MNLREMISDNVFSAMEDAQNEPGKGPQPYPDTAPYVDAILALIREALLSDEALKAASRKVDAHSGITAALDAVFDTTGMDE